MRSRDGLQIVCVVCEPKISEFKDQAVENFIISKEGEIKSNLSDVVIENILSVLNSSLHSNETEQSLECFITILESAIVPLKLLNAPLSLNTSFSSIKSKIDFRLRNPCKSKDSREVIEYFNLINRQLKILNDFDILK